MVKLVCKVCQVEKEKIYFMNNEQGRSVYKDEFGKIWHGKVCYNCFKGYVKSKSGAKPMQLIHCKTCNIPFMQKTIRQQCCSKKCYSFNSDSSLVLKR